MRRRLFIYDVVYEGSRISEMRNNILVNHDRLQYVYDDAGRVSAVRYVDSNGAVFTVVFLSNEGRKLTGLERDRKVEGGFIIDKTMSFSYYPDGNLMDITEHRPANRGVPDRSDHRRPLRAIRWRDLRRAASA